MAEKQTPTSSGWPPTTSPEGASKVRYSVYITGPPGSGKNALLTHMAAGTSAQLSDINFSKLYQRTQNRDICYRILRARRAGPPKVYVNGYAFMLLNNHIAFYCSLGRLNSSLVHDCNQVCHIQMVERVVDPTILILDPTEQHKSRCLQKYLSNPDLIYYALAAYIAMLQRHTNFPFLRAHIVLEAHTKDISEQKTLFGDKVDQYNLLRMLKHVGPRCAEFALVVYHQAGLDLDVVSSEVLLLNGGQQTTY